MGEDIMRILDLLMRDDLTDGTHEDVPVSLKEYILQIRRHSLCRGYTPSTARREKLPRHVAVGMIPKKIHEVTNFADYVDNLTSDVASQTAQDITHYVDFGSGQNYLGRALASPPYNKHIIAVESRETNNKAAKSMDVLARLSKREVVMRNKKLYRQQLSNESPKFKLSEKEIRDLEAASLSDKENTADLRPIEDLATIYTQGEGKGSIQYVEEMVDTGNLSEMVEAIKKPKLVISKDTLTPSADDSSTQITSQSEIEPRLMAISIHSCGNLSHHAIRSLLLNPSVKAIAIIGCCYNLMTEKLGPPTHKLPLLRPNQQPVNRHPRVDILSSACDPHGYPMSERVSTYNGGIRLNITARMMAVQAPQNWTEVESESFFTRHYYRALLQKVFLDYGVVTKPHAKKAATTSANQGEESESDPTISESTEPIIIGTLRKSLYASFTTYVRGAITKMTASNIHQPERVEKMLQITDEAISHYAQEYEKRKKELSIMWSLMAFSAGVVESLIVTDRWLYLKEHADVVSDAWVEAVFDYALSPRNLVVVGIKK